MKRNGFFVAAGLLSIIEAIGTGIGMIIMLFSLIAFATLPNVGGNNVPVQVPSENLEVPRGVMIGILVFLLVFLIVCFALSIFCAKTYLKNSTKSYEQVHTNSGKIITVIVFSFIIGGVLCGVIGLLGYLTKNETESSTVSTETTQTSSNEDFSRKLQQLKEMHDNGIISDAEYEKAREDVLKKF